MLPTDNPRMPRQSGSFISEFKKFALRGNVMDLAIGVIIGTAFNGIINSLVKDIIMPPLGLLVDDVNFSSLFINLSSTHYATLAEAQAHGVPTINYGLFINAIIDFLIIALVIFMVVRQINRLQREEDAEAPLQKECPFCRSEISRLATRCPQCTSNLT